MTESEILVRFFISIILNAPIGIIAARLRALTFPGGFIAAGTAAVCMFVLFPPGWVLMVLFFFSSSVLSSISPDTKKKAKLIQEKGACRDQYQILANSAIALILSLIYFINNGPNCNIVDTIYTSVFVALSSSTADTWSTELGMMSKKEPKFILNPRRTVPAGTSGGITILGTMASFAGGVMIAALFIIFSIVSSLDNLYSVKIWIYSALIIFSGFLGQLTDSFLGAIIQPSYECINCHSLIETAYHQHCDVKAIRTKGIAGFNNDIVNLTSTAIITVFFIALAIFIQM
ncbi:MAG: DUF92 domain-containing protein [Candidatus Hodarchaeales archaeon]